MSSSTAEAFSWEVMENIVDSCVGDELDYITLWQIALTCHGLLLRARIALFRHVRIRTNAILEHFLNAIQENRMLEGLVMKLTIAPRDPKVFYALFTSMSLSVDPTLSTPYHAPSTLCFTAVLFLELLDVTFRDKGDFVKLLWMFLKPRLLQLGTVEFKQQTLEPDITHPWTGAALKELESVDVLVRMTEVALRSDDDEVDVSRAGTKLISPGTDGSLGLHP